MSTSRCVLTLVVTLACVGCDRTRGDSAASEQELPTTMKASNVGNPPLPVLWIEPFDLQTSVDEARMLIAIAHNAGEAPSEILGELENNIRRSAGTPRPSCRSPPRARYGKVLIRSQ